MDHFLPKTKYPRLAYEWKNYRLARPKLNENKADSEQVIDPFRVRNGWFILECPSCMIHPAEDVKENTRQQIATTINVLDLNSFDLITERYEWLADLAMNKISFDYLNSEYPFLAFEIQRQGIKSQLKTLFSLN